MAGHSKWHNIRHRKEKQDKKRAKLFSKLVREITVAAREGDPDPEFNPRLQTAIERAKDAGMPKDNIEDAIARGAGEFEKDDWERVWYEGYGPGESALMVETLTDNRNRTHPELDTIFEENGGSLGDEGCVAWQFERRGRVVIEREGRDEDDVFELVLEADANDYHIENGKVEIFCEDQLTNEVHEHLDESGAEIDSFDIIMAPENPISVSDEQREKLQELIEELEDHLDVNRVFTNVEPADEDKRFLRETEAEAKT